MISVPFYFYYSNAFLVSNFLYKREFIRPSTKIMPQSQTFPPIFTIHKIQIKSDKWFNNSFQNTKGHRWSYFLFIYTILTYYYSSLNIVFSFFLWGIWNLAVKKTRDFDRPNLKPTYLNINSTNTVLRKLFSIIQK